jgi:anti-sigma-K factor RskA
MTHDELRDLIPAHAISALDEGESLALEAHLRDCDDCRAYLADYQRLGDDLLYATPPLAGPAGLTEDLRRRIAVSAPASPPVRPRFSFASLFARPAFGLALAGIALVLLVGTNLYWATRTARVEREVAAVTALARAPAIRVSASEDGYGRGVLFRPDQTNISLLCVWGMEPLPQTQAYQVWLISGEERVSGGTFQVTDEGYGILFLRPPEPLHTYDGLGITVEPAGGSPGPTSPRILGTEF